MSGIEEFEEHICYVNLFKGLPECFSSKVEEDIVTLACIDVDGLHRLKIRRMSRDHAYRVPGQPSLPYFWDQLSRCDIVREMNCAIQVGRIAGGHTPVIQ